MGISFSQKFRKQVSKMTENKPRLAEKILALVFDFGRKGKNSKYYRKRLQGNRSYFHELQLGGDIRIIVSIDEENEHAVLEKIGTHSQLGL